MKISLISLLMKVSLLIVFCISFFQYGNAQGYDRIEKGRMKDILHIVKNEVKKNYYDDTFHGIDLDARFKTADEKLNTAASTSQALAIIAQVLVDFNDSHLLFAPPSTTLAVEYGWRMRAIGDKVLVTDVMPESDAEAKGLKPGDQVISISGFHPSRQELWKVLYYYNQISKRDSLTLSVISPGQTSAHEIDVKSLLKKKPQMITFTTYFRLGEDFNYEENDKHRFQTVGGITIWRMPSFVYDPDQVDGLMDRVKNGNSLILDLRGNGGGYVKTMESLVSNIFDRDINIAELKGRKKMDPMVSKTRGKSSFKGNLIVLVDSDSGSASEIFSRLVQLEKRGKVFGDRSAGAVMQSRFSTQEIGQNSIVIFGINITMADVIMSDGKSLEHVGVTPDELILPTGADLAADRDPVLAKAIETLGGKVTPEEAGKYFEFYWK